MAERVRWGILSAAKIAREWVAPAIHLSQAGEIAMIASRTPGKAEALSRPYGDVRITDDYEAMLADDGIDAVYIPLPNGDHVEWTQKALAAGKHVLCEKPIALRAEQIDTLIAARDDAGKLCAEAFMVLHHPQWHRVHEILASGEIGPLRHVQGAFSFFNDDKDNIRNISGLGGGALRDIGVYPSVVTRFATGEEPVRIRSEIDWEAGIDATARVWAEFPSFNMDFYVSMRMAPRQQMVFHGTRATLTVETPFNSHLYGDDVVRLRLGDRQVTERFPQALHYVRQIDNFNATVLEGAPYHCPLEFSRGNQKMIDMIYDAAEGGS
ncbi:gfo/Idh/MocA family oxidoreductase [Rhodobacteraceae bacterium 2CG4]|uniref:Gfo/Idh/MocA family oxidoreductase n=1 Tax=Halovulum marinum TaxID=2662447 RepID=A0A6L5YW68_9RHOB|nr:Gfo/Idh/MocA family oxidoreductase [Halovulum marinum]MSU88596.1 gfo/Idh/MocA family oxidoreductase [Halovulum marinum]